MASNNQETISRLLEQGRQLEQSVLTSIAEVDFLLDNSCETVTRDTELGPQAKQDSKIVLDYLIGKSLDAETEAKAIQILRDWPSIGNIIQEMNEKEPPIRKENDKPVEIDQDVCLVNALKLHVCTLELTDAGVKCVSPPSLSHSRQILPTFLLEYLPPRNFPGQLQHPVRLCARRISGQVVIFGQEKLHSCDASKPMSIDVYYRHSYQRMATLLGSAYFELSSLLETKNFYSEVNLPVFHTRKQIIVGRLILKIQLGEEGTLAQKKPSVSLQPKNPNVFSKELHSARSLASTTESVPLVQHVIDKVPQLNFSSGSQKALLLRGFVHVTCSRNFKSKKSSNFYLVLKAFWIEDMLKSQIQWNAETPCFNFHENVPVLLSPYFLDRCRGNYAVLEVWNADSSQDTLIGIAKLPLHTFYLAYHDPSISQELLASKSPVVSVDHWVSVKHPVSGSMAGELKICMAFGSEEQVTYLEVTRGLREAMVTQRVIPKTENVTEDAGKKTHKLEIAILKISNFPLFETLPNGETDCYIDYTLPVTTPLGTSKKHFISDLAMCTLEPKFTSEHTLTNSLPSSTSLSEFLNSYSTQGAIFRVWCRLYHPEPRDVIVAQASLLPSDIKNLEDKYKVNKMGTTRMCLPLTMLPCPETSKICEATSTQGYITLKVSYSCLAETETLPKQLECETISDDEISQNGETSELKIAATQTALQMTDFVDTPQEDLIDLLTPRQQAHSISSHGAPTDVNILTPESVSEVNSPLRNKTPKRKLAYYEELIPEVPEEILSDEVINNNFEQPCESDQNIIETQTVEETSSPNKLLPHQKFRAHIEVSRAVRLPYLNVTMNGIKIVPPSTYVSVPGERQDELLASPVVLHSCDPCWNWHSDILIPAHLLLQESQHLILKLWQPSNCEGIPNPNNDSILSFAAVGVHALLSGLPQISGWFNLLNFAGQCCGQIKVCVTPLESLSPYQQLKESLHKLPLPVAAPVCVEEPLPVLAPLPSEENQQETNKIFKMPDNPFTDLTSSAISRKFEEQLCDLDKLLSDLKTKLSDMNIESIDPPSKPISTSHYSGPCDTSCCSSKPSSMLSVDVQNSDLSLILPPIASSNVDDKSASSSHEPPTTSAVAEVSESDCCSSENESVDSDVTKFLAHIDLETLHRLVEQLDDEAQKANHCSKPDYICESTQTPDYMSRVSSKPRQAPEGGNPIDKAQSSVTTQSSPSN